ncbi:MAG TPA: inositol monophosphatase family protein [Candidatus Aminicenantes bacterium]|nr:inositol monophosphatase family protein [Candidatus Aminicenantes bacterium]HRY63745.1 inositol monophosphatase family protein [Candidatus Aminicenantes bacterium]HRZ70658.1 inositol monophosphatase family protein [Candidatus Aminicenantes bacterium]
MDDLREFARIGEAAVREAGLYLRSHLGAAVEPSYKGTVDLVTPFDLGSQEILVGRLSAAFPDHGFLAEEGLARTGSSDCRWVIDPLDGTTNFAHGFPVFSVSAALECAGRTALGFVYDPMRDEMFRAEAGRGASLNGEPIRVSGVADLDRSLLATGFPYDVRQSPVNNLDHWGRLIVRAQAIRRCGSAALDLSCVACGRFDGFWELKLKPWDVAAGALIVREAGGRVSDAEDGPFVLDAPVIVATNGLIHRAVIDVLRMSNPAGGNDGR